MPQIPEEKIDFIHDIVDDLKDAVHTQTQAILALSERVNVTNEMVARVLQELLKPAAGDGLADLLKALVDADKEHAAALQKVLAAVQK